MVEKKNVLVYPCGTDEGLELNISLGQMIHYKLFGLDSNTSSRGMYIYKNYLGILTPNQPDTLDQLSQIVNQFKIDFIYPTSVEARLMLSKRSMVSNAEVVAPSYEACETCYSKSTLTALLKGKVDFSDPSMSFKGSRNIAICYTDRYGVIKFVRSVEERSSIIRESELDEKEIKLLSQTAHIINEELQLRGPWVFGYVISEAKLLMSDITPGFSSIMGFYRNKGINLATLSLFDRMGHTVEVVDHELEIEAAEFLNRKYRVNYDYDDVYVDLDDTILVNNQVNPLIVAFLYQCRNRGKTIHLITKHRHVLSETLEKHKIHALFDNVIWLKSFDQKSLHMKSERAIFIDDAFSERRQVSEKLGIPTFEVSAVESLMDWRQ